MALNKIFLQTQQADGIPPSRAEIYIRSRTLKDGSAVNEKVAGFMVFKLAILFTLYFYSMFPSLNGISDYI